MTEPTRRQPSKRSAAVASATPLLPRIDGDLRIADDADLEDREWVSLEVTADLTGRDLRRLDVSGCTLRGCRFTGADLQSSRWVDVTLVECELSGALLSDAVLTRVLFRNCRMSGAVLNSSKLRDVMLTECTAGDLGVRFSSLERVTFDHVQLRDADFTGAGLQRCRIFDCDATNVQFSKAKFDDVRLHGSDLSGARSIEDIRNVSIGEEQMHDVALALLAAHRIIVDPEREPDVTADAAINRP